MSSSPLAAGFTREDLESLHRSNPFHPDDDDSPCGCPGHLTLSSGIQVPLAWAMEDPARLKRLMEYSQILPVEQPAETSLCKYVFNMANFKRLAWFFLIGAAANLLLHCLGAAAAPTKNITNVARFHPESELYYQGMHFDNVSGLPQLFRLDDNMDNDAAFQAFMAAFTDEMSHETNLSKRDWYDCQFPARNYVQKFCCNTGHQIGKFLSATGAAALGGYATSLMVEAFNGEHDNKNPRSVCLTRDYNNLCVSWASYNTEVATDAEAADIAKYSVECVGR